MKLAGCHHPRHRLSSDLDEGVVTGEGRDLDREGMLGGCRHCRLAASGGGWTPSRPVTAAQDEGAQRQPDGPCEITAAGHGGDGLPDSGIQWRRSRNVVPSEPCRSNVRCVEGCRNGPIANNQGPQYPYRDPLTVNCL